MIPETDLWIFDDLYDQVEDGSKNHDVRIGYYFITKLRPGDLIRFKRREKSGAIVVRVIAIRDYPSINEMLEHEDHRLIAPTRSLAELSTALHRLYSGKLRWFGFYVIEFEKC